MAKVFKNIYRLKNGIRKTSKTYYFKATVDGKRRSINTGSANRKEAEKKALEFFETGQLPKPTMYKPNTIVAIIEELNWCFQTVQKRDTTGAEGRARPLSMGEPRSS